MKLWSSDVSRLELPISDDPPFAVHPTPVIKAGRRSLAQGQELFGKAFGSYLDPDHAVRLVSSCSVQAVAWHKSQTLLYNQYPVQPKVREAWGFDL